MSALLEQFADRMTREAMESMPDAAEVKEVDFASPAPAVNGHPAG